MEDGQKGSTEEYLGNKVLQEVQLDLFHEGICKKESNDGSSQENNSFLYTTSSKEIAKPRIAILHDPHAKYSPSNQRAVQKFCQAFERFHMEPTIIGNSDFHKLDQFDLLFIRDTTHPGNHTYEFSLAAEQLYRIPVLDDSMAIQEGSNKIWQAHMFEAYGVPYPMSRVLTRGIDQRELYELDLTFPLVVKIPDSCFSQGVYLAKNINELERCCTKIFHQLSEPRQDVRAVIVQEYIPTTFDWRIGILNKQIIYACKYYMAKDDWRIVKYDRQGNYTNGNHEGVPICNIPSQVSKVVQQCMVFLSGGLYGLDIKETPEGCYCIEINDNPSIDSGIEDQVEGDKLYNTVARWFYDRYIIRQNRT